MRPPRPRIAARRLAARLGITLAAVAFIAAATGGVGLAHRLVAHAGAPTSQPAGCSAGPHHADAHHHAPTGRADTPANAPTDTPGSDSESHDCSVCILLAAGATPPPPPVTLPARAPAARQAPPTASAPPARASRPLPPVRGPPSSSV